MAIICHFLLVHSSYKSSAETSKHATATINTNILGINNSKFVINSNTINVTPNIPVIIAVIVLANEDPNLIVIHVTINATKNKMKIKISTRNSINILPFQNYLVLTKIYNELAKLDYKGNIYNLSKDN